MDKHDINLNTGQVKFSNSMMGIFEDLKTNEVDPEVEALEPDVEPEVIVDKLGLMHEIPNDVFKSNKVFT